MSGLAELKRRRAVSLAVVGVFVIGLLAYGALSPSKEQRAYAKLRKNMRDPKAGERLSEDEQEALRKEFEKLSPQLREKLMRELMRDVLEDGRKEFKKIAPEDRAKLQADMVAKLREGFEKMGDKERDEIKKHFASEQGKSELKNAVSFMMTDLTAEERNFIDPVLFEFVKSIGN